MKVKHVRNIRLIRIFRSDDISFVRDFRARDHELKILVVYDRSAVQVTAVIAVCIIRKTEALLLHRDRGRSRHGNVLGKNRAVTDKLMKIDNIHRKFGTGIIGRIRIIVIIFIFDVFFLFFSLFRSLLFMHFARRQEHHKAKNNRYSR